MTHSCRLVLFPIVVLSLVPTGHAGDTFNTQIRPILQAKCFRCHGPNKQNAEVRLDNISTNLVENSLGTDTWHDALNAINKGEMPPDDAVRLTSAEREALTGWISGELHRLSESRRSTNGHVVMRRLNRFEYQNTMSDLLGLELDYAKNLPPDSLSEDGFQNNGATLRMSALQLEYYLKAARDGLQRAIVEGQAPPVFEHAADESAADKGKGNWTNRLGRSGQFVARIPEFPDEGDFVLQVNARAEIPDAAAWPVMQIKLGFRADVSSPARVVGTVDVSNATAKEFVFRGRFENFPIQSRTQSKYPGMLVWIENVYSDGKSAPQPEQVIEELPNGKKRKTTVWKEDPSFPKIIVESISFKAPVFATWPPLHHTNIVPRQPDLVEDERPAAEQSLRIFLPRAFRRSVDDGDVQKFLDFFDVVRPTANSFEAAMREVMAMALVSPDFLYIPEPNNGEQHLNEFELANRLSYFLWSTMPDQRLFQLARSGKLNQRKQLSREVRRMLGDRRSSAFVEQFADQWLDLMGIDRVAVNPQFYPDFDNALKPQFRQETHAFFGEILRSNESALAFLDSDFMMLNEPLARHYGIIGPNGSTFERVMLPARHDRGGLLAHGSVLLANSTGEDSHPIKRAVWIRERLLDDPPAPPPPDVPDLNQDLPELTALPLKKQLELHRENEACAACHRGIDPWGVALERFNAIGLKRDHIRRRSSDRNKAFVEHPVDATTQLPDGHQINGLTDLKAYLVTYKSQEFARTLVVKLLTYALGRTLEFSDDNVVDNLTLRFVTSGYKLRTLIRDIACSELFRGVRIRNH
ncbi:MAG: DUF1592 domain-containing protein [Fuerstiella sp.]|nr:DUF1592 domain-containing protein [Fuerstiella sp.]